ncbi:hypothetical protein AH06_254 [Erwinia phage AH06]|nr:hypothetical protein AH06_254 [Erwinia phage AH06]
MSEFIINIGYIALTVSVVAMIIKTVRKDNAEMKALEAEITALEKMVANIK